MNATLDKRYFNLWLDLEQAGRLEGIARERGVDAVAVLHELISPVLAGEDEATTGRFILLRVPESAYRVHLKWFEGDAELAKASMVGSVVNTAEDFREAMRKAANQAPPLVGGAKPKP